MARPSSGEQGRSVGTRMALGSVLQQSMFEKMMLAGFPSIVLVALAGCGTSSDVPRTVPLVNGQPSPTDGADMRAPVALAGREAITFAELAAPMAEIAGAQVLEEVALDRLLAQRAREMGVTVTQQQIAAEQGLFVRTMADEAGLSERDAAVALERVRASRGLGPVRYNALLTRNATLRALVAADAVPTAEQVEQELALATGARYRVRIITSSSQSAVAQAREQVLAQPQEARSATFGNLATSVSGDGSASRGGLLESVSPADPAVPGVIRSTLGTLAPGDVSPVLVLDAGFAILLMESPVAPLESDSETTRERVTQRVTLRLQRLAMDRLARELLAGANMTVLDSSLGWSRENRAGGR